MAVLIVVTSAIPLALSAQSAHPPAFPAGVSVGDSAAEWSRREITSCIAAIPLERMKSAPVYLHATLSDSKVRALTPEADLMAQDVAAEMRTALGAAPGQLPSIDSIVSTVGVPAELIVTARADGSVTRRAVSQSGDTTATTLLLAAFDAARTHGTALMLWPDGHAADSIIVRLVLWPSPLRADGSAPASRSQHSEFGAFRVLQPTASPALAKPNNPVPLYPFINAQHHVSGSLILEFVVDTAGRAEPATMHDIWLPQSPRLQGQLADYYLEFVVATKQAVATWKFSPARVGDCPVKQIVRLPMSFRF